MKKRMYPNYNNCCVNLANSLRCYFGLKTYHETLKELDEYLKNDYQNIIVFLYDGMGTNVYRKQIKKSFFDDYFIKSISSVGPPTTTAATISFQTGLYPSEHHWLGWNTYIEEEKEIITLFRNCSKGSKKEYPYNVGMKYLPYKTIVEEINEKGEDTAYAFFPFGKNPYESLDEMFAKVYNLTKLPGKKYIYVYYDNPDAFLHMYGSESNIVNNEIKILNDKTKTFCDKVSNSLVIVTADHGHIDVEMLYLEDYPLLVNILDGDISLEGRTVSFKVKRGCKKKFRELYQKYFQKDFLLFSQKEIIQKGYFGLNSDSRLENEIGDFIMLATSNKYLTSRHDDLCFYSAHAGITQDEMEIPLIVIPK